MVAKIAMEVHRIDEEQVYIQAKTIEDIYNMDPPTDQEAPRQL